MANFSNQWEEVMWKKILEFLAKKPSRIVIVIVCATPILVLFVFDVYVKQCSYSKGLLPSKYHEYLPACCDGPLGGELEKLIYKERADNKDLIVLSETIHCTLTGDFINEVVLNIRKYRTIYLLGKDRWK